MNDYRCLIYDRNIVEQPWFRQEDVCPCNTSLNNPTGRGHSLCPFGVDFQVPYANKQPLLTLEENTKNGYTVEAVPTEPKKYVLYPPFQYTAPQMEPRQWVRVGVEWRNTM